MEDLEEEECHGLEDRLCLALAFSEAFVKN